MKVEPVQRDGWVVAVKDLASSRSDGFIAVARDHPVGGWSVLGHAFFYTRKAARALAVILAPTGLKVRVLRARVSLRVR